MGEELSSTLVPLPIHVPIYHFDGIGRKGENDEEREEKDGDEGKNKLKYYSRRKKQEVMQEQG